MHRPILITGSSGLIGQSLKLALEQHNIPVRSFDIQDQSAPADTRNQNHVTQAITGCQGIVHLAAVSRVVAAQQNPEHCYATNVTALENIIHTALARPSKPWLIFASSREVYGQPRHLPTHESAPLQPINVYAKSKQIGEALTNQAQHKGLKTSIIRFSNVYGRVNDHHNRVIPAFARAAATGGEIIIEGQNNTFDFTHVDDVTRGLLALIRQMQTKPPPPPIHLVSGKGTTLRELASLVMQHGDPGTTIRHAPPRTFDVARFIGCPERAQAYLNWQAEIALEDGLKKLINSFRDQEALLTTSKVRSDRTLST